MKYRMLGKAVSKYMIVWVCVMFDGIQLPARKVQFCEDFHRGFRLKRG
jgi:hypothetical protein